MKTILKHRRAIFSLVLLFTAVTISGILIINPLASSFGIAAVTERIDVTILEETDRVFVVDSVDLYRNMENEPFKSAFSGDIRLTKGTKISIERIGNAGATIIMKNKGSVFFSEPGKEALQNGSDELTIRIDNILGRANAGEPVFFPVEGQVEIGKTNAIRSRNMSPALLRSGSISITGISKFPHEYFEAGRTELQLGDEILLEPNDTKAFGLIVANENPGLQTTFWANAERVRVLRPGAATEKDGYAVSATRLDRIIHGKYAQMVSIAFGVLIVVLTIAVSTLDIILFIRPREQQ